MSQIVFGQTREEYDVELAYQLLAPFTEAELAAGIEALHADHWIAKDKNDYQTVKSWRLSAAFRDSLKSSHIT